MSTFETWVAVGAAWLGTLLIVIGSRIWNRQKPSEAEAQLQQLSRDYAADRKRWKTAIEDQTRAHQAQMDAIRSTIVEFEVGYNYAKPEAVRRLLKELLSKTKVRGERA